MSNDIHVEAHTVTNKEIFYECPHCWTTASGTIYKTNIYKNGNIAKNRKPTLHHHGNEYQSANAFKNGESTHRITHCQHSPDALHGVYIHFTENTKRVDEDWHIPIRPTNASSIH